MVEGAITSQNTRNRPKLDEKPDGAYCRPLPLKLLVPPELSYQQPYLWDLATRPVA